LNQQLVVIAATGLALCGCTGSPATAPTPEAAKIIGTAERLAVFPDIADPE